MAAEDHFSPLQLRHACQTREQESLSTLKQVIRLSVSQIFFGRKVFAEAAFGEFDIGGTIYKHLRYPTKNSAADKLTQHLEAAFGALEKRYARSLELQISPKSEPNRIFERYIYVFDYGEKGDDLSVTLKCSSSSDDLTGSKDPVSLEESHQVTLNLLSCTSAFMNHLAPLKGELVVRYRLKYRPDTPADYVVPGFIKKESDYYQFEWIKYTSGTVRSDFYQMAMECFIDEELVHEEKSEDDQEVEDTVAMTEDQSLNVIPDSQPAEQSSPFSHSFQVGSTPVIRCLCGIPRNFSQMIICAGCSSLHRGCCYRILFEEDVPKKFYCSGCNKKSANGAYVDPSPEGLSIDQQNISQPVAEAIIRSLLVDEVLSEQSPDYIRIKDRLRDEEVPKYFTEACVDVPLLNKGVEAIEENDYRSPVRKRMRFNIDG